MKLKAMLCASAIYFIFFPSGEASSREDIYKKELINKLSQSFPEKKVKSIFSDPRLKIDRSVLPPPAPPPPKNEEERQRRLEEQRRRLEEIRARLFGEESVMRGVAYLREHSAVFRAAEMRYGVDAFVIASIIRNETNFGMFVRKDHPVINTLYSMYVLMPRWRNFAVRELSCFLEIAHSNGWDVFSIPGSNRGALGYPQFIPCSFKPFAADGNGDGRVDLFNHADAIMSVAKYLARNGWSSRWQDQHKAIFRYNRDTLYRDWVLEYRDMLARKFL